MTAFWLCLWSAALSLCWLLPNHYLPWVAFHSDAWCAALFLTGACAIALRTRGRVQWHATDVAVLGLACIPPIQYLAGLLAFSGQAVMASAYLGGLLLAMLTGARWEHSHPSQALHGLFGAIGLAAMLSVSLQLQTWLQVMDVGLFDIWSMGLRGARPYANLGQPNQLATLLILGVLASAWAYHVRAIGAVVAVLLAAFLLAGTALTQSRTACLGLLFLTGCAWAWRHLWRSPKLPWVASGLLLLFGICYIAIHPLGALLGVADGVDGFRGNVGGDLRLPAWRLFVDAALAQPWWGYGWAEVGRAQLAVADRFAALFPVFSHSHNLVLDLVLWLGIPLGLLVSVGLFVWFGLRLRAVQDAKDAIALMLLGALGIHAMLEFPLHYAYFLLPAGLVVGVVNQRAQGQRTWTMPRWSLLGGLAIAAVLLGAIVRDYLHVEASFNQMRFEQARIGTRPIGPPPDVLLLNQLRETINFVRQDVKEDMSPAELGRLQSVAQAYPGPGRLYKVAKALALNGRSDEAMAWLHTICLTASPDQCSVIQRAWQQDAAIHPEIAAVPWPVSEP
jgi:O-antigen ligase